MIGPALLFLEGALSHGHMFFSYIYNAGLIALHCTLGGHSLELRAAKEQCWSLLELEIWYVLQLIPVLLV